MALTDKQQLFITEYCIDQNKDITIEYVIKGLIYNYLVSKENHNRKYAAWLIKRIRPSIKLIDIESLLDMNEVTKLARLKEADIQKNAKFAQARRHEKRKDFALSDDEWISAIEYFNDSCAYCGDEHKKLTYDHFIPFSKGGSFKRDNIIPCCGKCNSSKKDNEFKEWYEKQPFYSNDRENKVIQFLKIQVGE